MNQQDKKQRQNRDSNSPWLKLLWPSELQPKYAGISSFVPEAPKTKWGDCPNSAEKKIPRPKSTWRLDQNWYEAIFGLQQRILKAPIFFIIIIFFFEKMKGAEKEQNKIQEDKNKKNYYYYWRHYWYLSKQNTVKVLTIIFKRAQNSHTVRKLNCHWNSLEKMVVCLGLGSNQLKASAKVT